MKRALLAGCAVIVLGVVAAAPARAPDQQAINKAIDRGMSFLRKGGAANPDFDSTSQPDGARALAGLALLECGAGPDDEVVRGIAASVRPASVGMHETYSLALSILFLDRLGDPADAPLIESMTLRLLAGQGAGGGWTYSCPALSDAESRRLTSHLKQQVELKAQRERPAASKDENEPDKKLHKRSVKELAKEIQDQLPQISSARTFNLAQDASDNSNTQFATVALWVGRRQGLPVENALARLDQRFRTTQNADGGWSYSPTWGGGSTASMTCAGLLGLAVAHGSTAEASLDKGKTPADPAKDRVMKTGLAVLGTAVGNPVGKGQTGPAAAALGVGGRSYYFLWSLERVAVALDLKTIGGKDWYGWGAGAILDSQAADGSWKGEYGSAVDTCFALLFLKRANLVSDLTARLKGKLQDPGQVTLKAAGGSDDLLTGTPGLKSGLESQGDSPLIGSPAVGGPVSSADAEGALLARELFQAPAERRGPLLEKYRDGKGVVFTEALAGAIPQMAGDSRDKAREALAERLTRMKVDTLVRYFQDQDAEIRRAAALAAAMKDDKALIPALINLLTDSEPAVARAAHAALKDMSGQQIGPSAEEWKAWWNKRQGK